MKSNSLFIRGKCVTPDCEHPGAGIDPHVEHAIMHLNEILNAMDAFMPFLVIVTKEPRPSEMKDPEFGGEFCLEIDGTLVKLDVMDDEYGAV